MEISHLSDVLDQVVKRLDQTNSLEYKLDEVIKRLDTLQHVIERQTEKQDLMEKNMVAIVKKLDSVDKSLNIGHTTVREHILASQQELDQLTTKIEQSTKKLESLETDLNIEHKTVREDLLAFKLDLDQLTTQLELSTNAVKDDIYRSKREIFAVTEKEAQIVKDRIEGPLPSHGQYTFDFYLENLKTLLKSDKSRHSPPWHINEMKSCVMGHVSLKKSGDMRIRLVHARHPREVGLKPVSGVRLKVKATICDIYKKVLQDVHIGEQTMTMNVTDINSNWDCGRQIGVTSCDDLIQKGYGDKEGYKYGALLIRYDVTVL